MSDMKNRMLAGQVYRADDSELAADAKDARASGETEQRLYALSAWRETPFFTDRERAALALTPQVNSNPPRRDCSMR
jgi:alkylhydroperoxidase family enzyme